ncbi:MAG: hypothetical protein JXB49_01055 [Bacteroidales bacterium]|nr:hypothetical protein [Bacteroidales bacterium]
MMQATLLLTLKQIADQKGVDALLPQNLSNSLLDELADISHAFISQHPHPENPNLVLSFLLREYVAKNGIQINSDEDEFERCLLLSFVLICEDMFRKGFLEKGSVKNYTPLSILGYEECPAYRISEKGRLQGLALDAMREEN